jgi:hypothetical protein
MVFGDSQINMIRAPDELNMKKLVDDSVCQAHEAEEANRT